MTGPPAIVTMVDDQHGGKAQQRLCRGDVDCRPPARSPWALGRGRYPSGTRLGGSDVEVVPDATGGSGDGKGIPRVGRGGVSRMTLVVGAELSGPSAALPCRTHTAPRRELQGRYLVVGTGSGRRSADLAKALAPAGPGGDPR